MFRKILPAFLLVFSGVACHAQSSRVNLVPVPKEVKEKTGSFVVSAASFTYGTMPFGEITALFAEESGISKGMRKAVEIPAGLKNGIGFLYVSKKEMSDTNAYRISILPDRINVLASGRSGALSGMQTVLQLIRTQKDQTKIPCADIYDAPRFSYRGMHLDVSRHFFPVEFIKKYISLMALYKMNTFHWHLVDGAGWRLEIKKYPELTRVAAWRSHAECMEWWKTERKYSEEGAPNAYGGYYTQEQAREIVEYARLRGITVIPEIEMPGHSEEVLAVYPELSCSGTPYKNSEFCIGNDATFGFLENVLQEVMTLFPSSYIHIGGDEASKKAWQTCPKCQQRIRDNNLKNEEELQSYAIRRMEKFLTGKKRNLLGWDEILEGGLAPNATVMSWRGEAGGIASAQSGHDVVMTPGGYCYFDSYQANPATQPETLGGYTTLEKVYSYEPVPAALNASESRHILGAQANVWTEYMPTTYRVEYMVFPRMLAMSEVLWSPASARNWDNFKARLQAHYLLLQRMNVNYYRPSYELQINTVINQPEKKTRVSFVSEQYQPEIRYTLDGTAPTASSALYSNSFDVEGSAKIQAAIFRDGQMADAPSIFPIDIHKALGKKVTYNAPYNNGYPAKKDSTLTNGYRGSLTYGDGQWQGFLGKGFDVTIDMETIQNLQNLSVGFMQLTGPGVYMPDFVEVFLSDDGKEFKSVEKIMNDVPPTHSRLIFKDFKFNLSGNRARYIQVKAKIQKGFIFTDEIIVY